MFRKLGVNRVEAEAKLRVAGSSPALFLSF